MAFTIIPYEDGLEERWDRFVMQGSVNGTFLQTRNFLNYHPPGRFEDASLLVMQGSNIAAVIPACDTLDEGERCFFSHKGSTFGGLVLAEDKYNITALTELLPLLDRYLEEAGYEKAILKSTSDLFCKRGMDLLDYCLFQRGYAQYNELSLYIDLREAPEDLTQNLSSSKRRDYRYSLKNDLTFRRLETADEIAEFYELLRGNLERLGAKPVHTLEELLDFKAGRLADIVEFYGVSYQEKLIAGSMVFCFGDRVFHTQYLAQDNAYANLYTMNFLDFSLIELARRRGFASFSFGTSTKERGKELNKSLAIFKEGFGCQYKVNRTYYKQF